MLPPFTVQTSIAHRACTLALTCVFVMLLGTASCGGSQFSPQSEESLSGMVEDGQHARSRVAQDPLRPILVEWPATEKAALLSSSEQGVVFVSYDGYTLRLLTGCALPGEYRFTPTSRSIDGLEIANRDDLYAKLPLGAVSLKGELGVGKRISVKYVAVGARTASIMSYHRAGLPRHCSEATHFIKDMVVGAYRILVLSDAALSAGVDVQSIGAGGSHSSSGELFKRDGDLDACIDQSTPAEDRRCQAVIQLALVPLETTAAQLASRREEDERRGKGKEQICPQMAAAPAHTAASLFVAANVDDKAHDNDSLVSAVTTVLADGGLAVDFGKRKRMKHLLKKPLDISPPDFTKLVPDTDRFIVVAYLRGSHSSGEQGGIIFYRGDVTIRVIDASSSRVLCEISKEGKGAGNDVVKATKALAKTLEKAIEPELRQLFAGPSRGTR